MTTPRRFTDCAHPSAEGRLLAAGRAEFPDHAALHRAALRLGLPVVAMGAASAAAGLSATATSATAAATATTTTTTTAATATAATVAASTVLPSASGLLTASFLKATVIGLVIGAGTIGTADLAFHESKQQPAAVTEIMTSHTGPRAHASRQAQQRQPLTGTPSSTEATELTALNHTLVEPTASASARHRGGLGNVDSGEQSANVSPPANARNARVVSTADFDRQLRGVASSSIPKTHLGSEVESLDRARAAVSRGDAAGALRELDEFASRQPYRLLAGEVMLVRIDALLALGNRNEAAALARQLLQMGAPAPQRARLERLARMK